MRACAKDPHAVPQLAPSDIDERSPLCGLEMGSLASIDRFVDELASQGVLLDGLINNAGMVPISCGVTAEGFEPAFGINYLGTVHMLELHR
jgi:NAD(P)-dependent dehydrogenase (short-subunit alcohol dehydrogenase family)